MPILYRSLLQRMRNNLTGCSGSVYGEGRNVDTFLEELQRFPPDGPKVVYQDLSLCRSVADLVKGLKTRLKQAMFDKRAMLDKQNLPP